MIDLIDSETDIPQPMRLKLSAVWRSIRSDRNIGHECYATLWIGAYLGEHPLFAPIAYTPPEWCNLAPPSPGLFFVDDDGCYLLKCLWNTLQTSKKNRFLDVADPSVSITIHPIASRNQVADFFEVMTVFEVGGPWHGRMTGESGPAMNISVTRQELTTFFYELLEGALDPAISDETSRLELQNLFAEAIAMKPEKAG